MKCSLCKSEKHNARKCPKNPDKGKKNVMKKKMQAEIASQALESSNSEVAITNNNIFICLLFLVSSFSTNFDGFYVSGH